MTCKHDRTQLVAFHFGELPADERTEVEARLAACPACLGEYLAIKRAIEMGEDAPRPSDRVRERLRRAVAAAVLPVVPPVVRPGPRPVARRRWWDRPVAVAFAASVMVAAVTATQAMVSGPGAPPMAMTSREPG